MTRGLYCPPGIPPGFRRNPVHSGNSGGMRFGSGASQIGIFIPRMETGIGIFPESHSRNHVPGIGRNGIRRNQYILNNTKLGITQIGQPWFKRRHVTHFFPPPLSIPTTTTLPRRRRRSPGDCSRLGQASGTTTATTSPPPRHTTRTRTATATSHDEEDDHDCHITQ